MVNYPDQRHLADVREPSQQPAENAMEVDNRQIEDQRTEIGRSSYVYSTTRMIAHYLRISTHEKHDQVCFLLFKCLQTAVSWTLGIRQPRAN